MAERVMNLNIQHAELVHCPICGYILWKPVTCSLCENSFCLRCIEKWICAQQKQIVESIDTDQETDYISATLSLIRCPFNCLPYNQRKCPSVLTIILSKLRIECRNHFYGCREILFYEQLERHEEELCPYSIIQCSGCQQTMFKTGFDQDEHLARCSYVQFQCENCHHTFKCKDTHNQLDCMKKQIDQLKEYIITFEQYSSKRFDLQRKKMEIMDEKLNLIENIWATDDD